jgi:hypothetical protein
VAAKVLLLMGEKYEDCTKGGAKILDWSDIEFEYTDDTTYFLKGMFLNQT